MSDIILDLMENEKFLIEKLKRIRTTINKLTLMDYNNLEKHKDVLIEIGEILEEVGE